MFDAEEFRRWFASATDAAENARAQSERGSHHWACFLAEQAAQFASKGLLHGLGRGAWGHDLAELGQGLSDALGEEVPKDVRTALLRLSRHYIATRYPDAHPSGTPGGHYSAADTQQALADAKTVMDYIDDQWRALQVEGEGDAS